MQVRKPAAVPMTRICAQRGFYPHAPADVHIIGSVRGYQAIFVPLAALSSPGYSPVGGQPAVYLYIAALEANCPLMAPLYVKARLRSAFTLVEWRGRGGGLSQGPVAGGGAAAPGVAGGAPRP